MFFGFFYFFNCFDLFEYFFICLRNLFKKKFENIFEDLRCRPGWLPGPDDGSPAETPCDCATRLDSACCFSGLVRCSRMLSSWPTSPRRTFELDLYHISGTVSKIHLSAPKFPKRFASACIPKRLRANSEPTSHAE